MVHFIWDSLKIPFSGGVATLPTDSAGVLFKLGLPRLMPYRYLYAGLRTDVCQSQFDVFGAVEFRGSGEPLLSLPLWYDSDARSFTNARKIPPSIDAGARMTYNAAPILQSGRGLIWAEGDWTNWSLAGPQLSLFYPFPVHLEADEVKLVFERKTISMGLAPDELRVLALLAVVSSSERL